MIFLNVLFYYCYYFICRNNILSKIGKICVIVKIGISHMTYFLKWAIFLHKYVIISWKFSKIFTLVLWYYTYLFFKLSIKSENPKISNQQSKVLWNFAKGIFNDRRIPWSIQRKFSNSMTFPSSLDFPGSMATLTNVKSPKKILINGLKKKM